MNEIRLQLVLAKAGVASRRAAEALITSGRVAVNGRVQRELGTKVDPIADRITVDGREVRREPPAYFLLNKPKGYVTTAADPEGRPTVFDLVQQGGVRLFAVGRLDFNTEGALLLSNDGELAHALMHPSRGVEKVYHAKLRHHITVEQLDRLRRGVVLPPARPLDAAAKPIKATYPQKPRAQEKPERSAPCEIAVIKETGQHTWVEFVLHEGKNRQIHRMAEAIGSSLLKLMRVEYAGLHVQNLGLGESRALTGKEIATLRKSVGLSEQLPDAPVELEAPPKPRGKPPAEAAERPRKGPPQGRPLQGRPSQARPSQARAPQARAPQARAKEPPRPAPHSASTQRGRKPVPPAKSAIRSGRDLRLRSEPDHDAPGFRPA